MREIHLNGYIDEEVWFGDEITPGILHDELYSGHDPQEDVRIILNSYGGSCNAATRMFDDIRAYPGNVHLIVSGTAASAATVVAMAADRLEMTPGSLFMCHDPLMGIYGNEAELLAGIDLLRVCKDSIINIYQGRSWKSREELAEMMTATTWMDANQAKANGFIDGVVEAPSAGIDNAAFTHTVDLADAQKRVNAWIERRKPMARVADQAAPVPENAEASAPADDIAPVDTHAPVAQSTTANLGTPVAQLQKRLSLLQPYNRH